MKILKVNKTIASAYKTIKNSMSSNQEVVVLNNLDACGCTGNGNC